MSTCPWCHDPLDDDHECPETRAGRPLSREEAKARIEAMRRTLTGAKEPT